MRYSEHMKYSVIIPAFNAEKTLRRCLDSLLRQDYQDVELLLINDGSTDGSESILREYSHRDPRIRAFSQENRGVSSARNLGLQKATGEYILFVDSDDYAEPGYFEKLDHVLANGDPELVFLSYRLVGEKAYTISMQEKDMVPAAEIAELVAELLRKQKLNALWSKVFLRRVIEDRHLRFDETLDIDEDLNFIFAYILGIERLRFSSEILYNTTLENPDSLTRRKRDYLCEQLHRAGLRRKDILKASSLKPESKIIVENALDWLYYRGVYSSAAELLKYPLRWRERRVKIREICCVFSEPKQYPDCSRRPMISVPVRFRMTGLIYLAAKAAVRKRKL